MKQTAVEWLEERLTLSFGDELKSVRGFFVIAKEMEKEQITESYEAGIWDLGCRSADAEQYYNETFNTK
jgi:hypothetical protein